LRDFAEYFSRVVEGRFAGVFAFSGVFWMVNRGEVVVDSW
jgi:hypothetical protein